MCYYINKKGKIMKSYEVNKPNVFFYGIFRIASLIASAFLFNLKVKRNEIKNKKGRYIVIANHESFIDFINLCSCNRNRMHFIVSNSFYQSLPINPILKKCGVIPKQQFQTSIEDLKKMKAVIDNDMPLVIYPAGLMSEDGISTKIPKGTAKLLKWLNCDVYVAKTTGSYFTYPKWSKNGFRKGRITLDIYKLYDKEKLKDKSNEEMQQEIDDILFYDCYKYQEKELIVYKKHKNISGLENVLYKCLKCNSEFTMITDKNKLICNCCNNTAVSDKYGFLHKENEDDIVIKYVSDYSSKIKNEIRQQVEQDENFIIESHAKVSMIDYKKHKFVEVGDIDISLKRSVFTLNGIINNEKFYKEILTNELFILPFSPGKYFEIQSNKDIYRIHLDDPRQTVKWINILKAIYDINHAEVKQK